MVGEAVPVAVHQVRVPGEPLLEPRLHLEGVLGLGQHLVPELLVGDVVLRVEELEDRVQDDDHAARLDEGLVVEPVEDVSEDIAQDQHRVDPGADGVGAEIGQAEDQGVVLVVGRDQQLVLQRLQGRFVDGVDGTGVDIDGQVSALDPLENPEAHRFGQQAHGRRRRGLQDFLEEVATVGRLAEIAHKRRIGRVVHGGLEDHDAGVLQDDAADAFDRAVHVGTFGLHDVGLVRGHLGRVVGRDAVVGAQAHGHGLVPTVQGDLDGIHVDDQVALDDLAAGLHRFALFGRAQHHDVVGVFGVEIDQLAGVEGLHDPLAQHGGHFVVLHLAVQGDRAHEFDVFLLHPVPVEQVQQGLDGELADVRRRGGRKGLAVVVEGDQDPAVSVDEFFQGRHVQGIFEGRPDPVRNVLVRDARQRRRRKEHRRLFGQFGMDDVVSGISQVFHCAPRVTGRHLREGTAVGGESDG